MSKIKIPMARFESAAKVRRKGFREAVLACAQISGDEIEFDAGTWHRLSAEYVGDIIAHEPTIAELARNFGGAVAHWLAAGAPVCSPSQYAARSAACAACEFWDDSARGGLGRCNAPGCGCTLLKRWMATEVCPLRKWPAS